MPDAVKTPPKTAQELLAWTGAHKGQFIYARPANSGPGRAFLMGLPYILGDQDPMDPDKTAGTRPGPICASSARTSNTTRPAPAR